MRPMGSPVPKGESKHLVFEYCLAHNGEARDR
jgi:hypothetical protein